MKNFHSFFSFLFPVLTVLAPLYLNAEKQLPSSNRQNYKIYVDKNGVMRRSDTKEEVSYYGTNYTLPFAHAYRAIKDLDIDHKEAIDKDVYHLSRLGFNGFRLHLWDVEISDSAGNLLQNDHLDLLDYLISRLEKNGIDIILTAQTNFGNGYPEKNIDTGAFTYDYDKCEIHSNKEAQNIQANYLEQLAAHVNTYTGKSYADDNAIIAMEINNEPCHKAPAKEVTDYINKMVKALKKGGFNKPILYNVSHNEDVTEAYYNADIQGTTFQWYPTGLVAGHQRKGNFLPYVQDYNIPWKDSMKNYDKLARVVYEFDPGDVLYSYLYPAIARTFRKEGFQWITQFAYDPIDIAQYNTEYQTHFLNLAYTPSKALSMLIAGEVARNIPRNADFGPFPTDTAFGDFKVSAQKDFSLYNSPEKYYYSNTVDESPKDSSTLKYIAGTGSSPIISYDGTGAYFLDMIEPGLWRLEVMPDVVIISDPFRKPSLYKEIAKIYYSDRQMTISLPQLGNKFFYQAINDRNSKNGESTNGTISVYPGTYLLSQNKVEIEKLINSPGFKENPLRTFVAPQPSALNSTVVHNPTHYINPDGDLEINATIMSFDTPKEVMIYPSYVSFWNDKNTLIPMVKTEGNNYYAKAAAKDLGWDRTFNYNIVVKEEDDWYYTWPGNIDGNPLDWDFIDHQYYSSKKLSENSPVVLMAPKVEDENLEVAMIPEAWNFRLIPELNSPVGIDSYFLSSNPDKEGKIVVRRYIDDELSGAPFLNNKETIVVKTSPAAATDGATIALVGKNGATYATPIIAEYMSGIPVKLSEGNSNGIEYHIPISALKQVPTNIIPAPYPSFLKREIEIEPLPFDINAIDFVEFSVPAKPGQEISLNLEGIWLQ